MTSHSDVSYTDDLSIFKSGPNRRTEQPRVLAIAADIVKRKNMLHAYPIVVDADLRVIDGDHRLAAARAAGVGIHYIRAADLDVTDQAIANALTKSWTIRNWAEYYAGMPACASREHYQFLLDLADDFPRVPFRCLMESCNHGRDIVGSTAGFKQGKFTVTSPDAAETIAQWVTDFRSKGLPVNNAFSSFVARLYDVDGYDHKRMMHKLDRNPAEVIQCANTRQYLDHYERLYNWGAREGSRLYLRAA